MNREQKLELRRIIKEIEHSELPIKKLWRRHYPFVSYSTFYKYYKIFSQSERGKK